MKRTEVMDLIQRQLDGDLTAEEQLALEAHLRTDSEMQLFRQRLQRVSGELNNLPRVTPPFSLVDSILPKLQSLDTPAPARTPAATEAVETAMHMQRLQPIAGEKGKQKKHARTWVSKSVIGAVAASLLLGIFTAYGWKGKEQQVELPEAGVPGKEHPYIIAPVPPVEPPKKQESPKQDPKPDKKTEKQQPEKKAEKGQKNQNQAKPQGAQGQNPGKGQQQKERPEQNESNGKEDRRNDDLEKLKEKAKGWEEKEKKKKDSEDPKGKGKQSDGKPKKEKENKGQQKGKNKGNDENDAQDE